MRKSTFSGVLLIAISTFFLLESCRNDAYLTEKPPVPDQSFSEEFDTTAAALSRGWVLNNQSDPVGPTVWQDGGGIPPFFASYSNNGTYAGFIGTDYQSTSAAAGVISNWLISPKVIMKNGDKIIFYTRALTYSPGYTSTDVTDFSNRMRVRISRSGSDDPSTFGVTLLDINPLYIEWHNAPGTYGGVTYTAADIANAYPAQWTKYEVTVNGLTAPVEGRFAFEYYLDGGGYGGYGSGIGIDHVQYVSAQ